MSTRLRASGLLAALVAVGLLTALVSALLAGAAASTGAAPSWVNTGPEGGDLGAIAIHPRSPQVVYANSYNGLFRSTDGGATWQRRPAQRWLQQITLDPADPQTLYAVGGGGLYRTTDAGASWTHLHPFGDIGFDMGYVAVSPSWPRTIYFLVYGECGGRVLSSADAGRTWVEAGCIEAADWPAAILVDPRRPRTVYVWTSPKGIFRSEDGGATWTRASAGLPVGKLSSLAAHPTRSGVLYAGSEHGGVFRSLDAGSTWKAVARGLDGEVTDLAVSAADGAVYAGTSARDRGDGVERGSGIVYRSADGRAPWRARSDGLTGWNVQALAAHPRRPGTLLAGTEHGIFGTEDGGASWVERVRGFVASSSMGLAVDPANAGTVFATVERGVAVSRDGGRTWGTALDLRREHADVRLLLAVPGTPVTLYTVKSSHAAPKPRSILVTSRDAGRSWVEVGALPRPIVHLNWDAALVGDPTDANTVYLVSRGIFKSVDAGRTWTRIYSAVGKPRASSLAVDPFGSSVLYTVVRGRLRTSENGGRSWRELPGIPQASIWQFALDPHRRGTVYAVTGGWINLVYVSKDRGQTWSKLGESPWAGTLLVDPVRPGVVYVGESNGVYVKRPGATMWQAVGPAGRSVSRLATDAKGRRLYAGIEGGGVAATRLPLPTAGIRSSTVRSRSSAKPGARLASQPQGLIAFTRDEGDDAVYVVRPDGSDLRRVWRGSHSPTDVAWSPDGSKLAVSTWRSIWVVNADGTDPVRVARVGASSLSWSADGRRIAFTRSDIWLMNADGSNMRRLKRTPELSEHNVDWSPVGGRIAFDSGGYVPLVYVMRTDGSGLHRAARVEGAQPDWSPDGRRIAYTRPIVFPGAHAIGPENGEIWVMNASGTSQVRLTKNRVYDGSPAWSPDGQRIVFVRDHSKTRSASEIYVMNADGTSVKRLTTGASPAWQPIAPAGG